MISSGPEVPPLRGCTSVYSSCRPIGLKNSANLRFAGKTMEACERTRAKFHKPPNGGEIA